MISSDKKYSGHNSEVFSRNAELFDADYWRPDEEEAVKFLLPGKLFVGGVGTGRTIPHLPQKRFEIVAGDISPEMVRRCQKRFPDLDVSVIDIQSTPFADGTFDSVFLPFHTISYVDDLDGTLREMRRILKPGGRLLFTIPNFWYIRSILGGAVFQGKRHWTSINRRDQSLATNFLGFGDRSRLKKIFSSVKVAERISLGKIEKPNWKDRVLKSLPFIDKALYFFCIK